MKILAVDTASFPASVAIMDNGIVLGEYVIRNQRKHSQNIMVMIERLLDDLSVNISEIDVFAVTTGPGSFTGLRIGISTVRALAQATGKPVVAVNTLEVLAHNVEVFDGIIVPMLDARRDEVFTAAYSLRDSRREIIAPCVMTINEIIEKYKDEKVMFIGDGALMHRDELAVNDFLFAPMQSMETRAVSLCAVAYKKATDNELMDYNAVRPLYLRKSQAEREYERKKDL